MILLSRQTPATLTNRNSNQMIKTTLTKGNTVSHLSMPTNSKHEVSSNKCSAINFIRHWSATCKLYYSQIIYAVFYGIVFLGGFCRISSVFCDINAED